MRAQLPFPPRRRAPIAATGALLLLGLPAVLTGCSGGFAHRSVAATTGSIEVPAGTRKVRFEIQNGSVRVLPGPSLAYRGQVLRAAETADALRVLEAVPPGLAAAPPIEGEEGTLRIAGPVVPPGVGRHQVMLGIEIELTVPPELELEIVVAGSGRLWAQGRRAATRLATGRGDLDLLDSAGPAELRSGAGNITVYEHRGDLDVRILVGSMQIYVREPAREITLVTGAGNIQCLIPPETGFRVSARTETGKLANGFGLPIEKPTPYSAVTVGAHGDGATSIVMRSDSGHLSLSHKRFD